MADLDTIIELLQKQNTIAEEILETVRQFSTSGDDDPSPGPDPEEPPMPATIKVRIKREPHAIAFWKIGENKSGVPILSIYPSEKREDVPFRIKFLSGRIMSVEKNPVIADGNTKFWKFPYLVNDLELYLNSDDVTKLE